MTSFVRDCGVASSNLSVPNMPYELLLQAYFTTIL